MEERLLLWIHEHSSPALDVAFFVSHAMGTLPFCAILVVTAALWHRRRGEREAAWRWLALGAATFVLQEGIKAIVARPRPELWPSLLPSSGAAFPSGHALAAATFYPLLAWSLSRARPRLAPWLWAAAVLLAVFVGVGRLYLGVHWPTDVAAGWTLGAAQTAVALAWKGRRRP
ncbi:MAG TPA: phosphatase PAP2 family protein [Vicinamibacteria bacterium]|nr:phosphatase PAP2 family protein [Vicinamibacteria bacterium]